MELVNRPLDDGFSAVDLSLMDGNLVVCEHDSGRDASKAFGTSDVEYFLSVPAPEMSRLLDRLLPGTPSNEEITSQAPGPIGAAILARFGLGMDLVSNYRQWLQDNEIPFTTHIA